MTKTILTKDQVNELVLENKYPIDPKKKFFSRCIDGRYKNDKNLPALAFPGGDAGELALILATGNAYGFKVDLQKVYLALLEIVGGVKNFNFHTDSHTTKNQIAAGCGYMSQIRYDPQAYQLEEDQVGEIVEIIKQVKKEGACEIILEGEHREGAVLQVKGDYGVYPQYFTETEEVKTLVQVFVYHQTLVDERHKLWSKKLYENKAVELFPSCNDVYLYQVLSEMAERHLLETAKRLTSGFPIYLVEFNSEGGFTVEEMGRA